MNRQFAWAMGSFLFLLLSLAEDTQAQGSQELRVLPVQVLAQMSRPPNEPEYSLANDVQNHCLSENNIPDPSTLTSMMKSSVSSISLQNRYLGAYDLVTTVVEASCGIEAASRGYAAPFLFYYYGTKEGVLTATLNIELVNRMNGSIVDTFRVRGRGKNHYSTHWAWILWRTESSEIVQWEDVFRVAMDQVAKRLSRSSS